MRDCIRPIFLLDKGPAPLRRPATNRNLGAGTEMNGPSPEGRFAGGVFPSVLQPPTGGECVPGFSTGIQGEVIPLCPKRACVRKTAIRAVVGRSGRRVDEWDTLWEQILFFRRPAWRQRAAGPEWLVLERPGSAGQRPSLRLSCVWYRVALGFLGSRSASQSPRA